MGNAEEFVIANGILTSYHGRGGAVVIPDGVKVIDHNAFRDCTSLTSVSIPESVTGIGDDAFSGCTGLIIYAPAGSCGEAYAKKKGIPHRTV